MHLGHISYPLVITSLIPRYLQLTTFTVQSLPTSLLPPPTGHEDLMITLSSFFHDHASSKKSTKTATTATNGAHFQNVFCQS